MKRRSLLVLIAVVVTCFGSFGCKSKTRTRTVYVETHQTPPAAALKLLVPDGGELWPIGSTPAVAWTPVDPTSPVDIEYTTDGSTWSPLAMGTDNDGMESITVPSTPSSTARIRVTETASGVSDTSDADFAFAGILVTSPNGGEVWKISLTGTVTWVAGGFPGTVDIHISTDGVSWVPLVVATPNDGSETIAVALTPSTTARIRISQTAGALSDESDGDFTIQEVWEDIGAGLTGLDYSSLAWGDYDNDGDLDLAVAGGNSGGAPECRIYRNDGGGIFTDIGAGLTGVYYCSLAWGDYDNDGDLDLAVAGRNGSGGADTRIYRNDGGGIFTNISAPLTGVYYCSLAWGDYDNDGDLDLAVAGQNGSGGADTRIYRNDGGGVFTDIGAGLAGVYYCSLAWGDYDNDGDMDLAIAGYSSSGPVSRICRNDGGGVFIDISAGLTGVYACSLAWGDYDNDGDLDLAIAGYNSSSPVSLIYRNGGGGTFTDSGAALTGVFYGSVAWGDYDNDGDLDLAISGYGGSSPVSRIYRNDGGGVFTDSGTALTGVYWSSIAWGDYDNDGDLDIALSGEGLGVYFTKIYKNNLGSVANAAPSSPSALSATPGAGSVLLSWSAPADDHTPAAGLSYNLRVGSAPGASDACSSMANGSTGNRRVPRLGPVQTTSAKFARIGTWYWSVQAVDSGLKGGAWATGGTFTLNGIRVTSPNGGEVWVPGSAATVTWTSLGVAGTVDIEYTIDGVTWLPLAMGTANDGTETVIAPSTGSMTARVRVAESSGGYSDVSDSYFTVPSWVQSSIPLTGLMYGSVAWGDYDGDGDLDLAVAGYNGVADVSRIYRNDGGGTFVDIGAAILGAESCSLAWGDYDNDGDLDLAIAGTTSTGRASRIYRNDGGDVFTDIGAALTGADSCSLAWGDYDNDGDLDLAIAGNTWTGRASQIYRNDGGDVFTDIGASLTGVSSCSLAWGDYDNDGDLDLVVAGQNSSGAADSRIYRNDGGGLFTDIGAALQGVEGCSLAWGDYDNDGDLDLAIAGFSSSSFAPVCLIYRNDGVGVFTDISAGLTGVYYCSLAWGDYDNDGDLDLAVAGQRSGGSNISRIYRNAGGGIFLDAVLPLTDVNYCSLAWGDYNGDGLLDLALAGADPGGGAIMKIYDNHSGPTNTPPAAPSLVSAIPLAGSVALTWTAPADDFTPAAGLNYNLRIGTSPGGSDVLSPMADVGTGARLVPRIGSIQGTAETISLPSGTYYWSVQAVDTGLMGGVWATEGSFTIP